MECRGMRIRLKHIHILLWTLVALCALSYLVLRQRALAEAARREIRIEWGGYLRPERWDPDDEPRNLHAPELCKKYGLRNVRVAYLVKSDTLESSSGIPLWTSIDEIFRVIPAPECDAATLNSLERDVFAFICGQVIPGDAPRLERGMRTSTYRNISGELAVLCSRIARYSIVLSVVLVFAWLARQYLCTVRSDTRWMKGQCRECGYQIDRLPVCPECGTPRE